MPTWTITLPDFDTLTWSTGRDGRSWWASLGAAFFVQVGLSRLKGEGFYAQATEEGPYRLIADQRGFETKEAAQRWAYAAAMNHIEDTLRPLLP